MKHVNSLIWYESSMSKVACLTLPAHHGRTHLQNFQRNKICIQLQPFHAYSTHPLALDFCRIIQRIRLLKAQQLLKGSVLICLSTRHQADCYNIGFSGCKSTFTLVWCDQHSLVWIKCRSWAYCAILICMWMAYCAPAWFLNHYQQLRWGWVSLSWGSVKLIDCYMTVDPLIYSDIRITPQIHECLHFEALETKAWWASIGMLVTNSRSVWSGVAMQLAISKPPAVKANWTGLPVLSQNPMR